MSEEQAIAVANLNEAIGSCLFRLRECSALGLKPSEALTRAGMEIPLMLAPALDIQLAPLLEQATDPAAAEPAT